ncbi:MAG: amino acid ABC transporter permease [Eubacteriales bacterium]|nr:amino acid ABC transporter permease [Eubacteriales bacterium]MDD3883187.1 amino acid ABC transporter permease [Eubacteriales bacterium]MDD4513342.1 amino acid ABC transporter permease [Eubacteriales bacterium]
MTGSLVMLAQAASAGNVFDGWWLAIQERAFAGDLSFWENIYKEIYQNFLQNDRWLNYLRGLGITLEVSFFAALLGVVLGTVLALMRLSNVKIFGVNLFSKLAGLYIGVIRGTPMLLQVLIINFGIFGNINLDKVIIGVIACGLNSAAYVAEIIRGGILSVDKGQTEAGRSLGLSQSKTMRLIVLPQALKTSLPPLCNEFIALIKETSILAYIALTELTKAGDLIRSRTYSAFTPYIISGLLYLIVVSILTKLLGILERRLRQGDNR